MPQTTLKMEMLDQFTDLYVWKKDLNLNFIDLNESAAKAFGFYDRRHAIGKSDFDIPSKLSQFANVFRSHDMNVIKNGKLAKFLEIQPCANNIWKILQVEKFPWVENGKVTGVIGYSTDITKYYIKLDNFLLKNESKMSDQQTSSDLKPNLSLREFECLFFLLRKCTAKEIANIFSLSYRTIEHYIETLKLKFNCKTSIDLIQKAKKLGYFNMIPHSIIQKQISIIVD